MALIPPFFLDCVVAIGTLNENGEKIWIGTGFLIGKFMKQNEDKTKNYSIYIVTNKHVLKNLKQIVIRFNPQTDQVAKDFVIDAIDGDGKQIWTGHANINFDVAVIQINGKTLEKEGLKFGLFASDDSLISKSDMIDKGISEGDFVFVLGFPMGLVGVDRQNAILRSAVIAKIRDFFENRNTDFVVDAFVFPGNSGGPVVLKPELTKISGTKSIKSAGLIGIIKSYIPYQDVAISQQTGQARVIFEENTGLALVEPVDHIMETIEEDERIKKAVN